MRLSIRWRLTLWYTLALALVLLGFGGLVYALLADARGRIDQALNQRAEEALGRVDRTLLAGLRTLEQDRRLAGEPAGRLRQWIYEFKEHENVSGVVYDPQGKVVERTRELAADSVPPAPRPVPAGVRFTEETFPVIGRQRMLAARLGLAGRDYALVLLASLEEVGRVRREVERERREVGSEFRQLFTVLLIAVPAAVALTGGLGYLLARKALAPVDQLNRMTEEISADRLDRRLPVANPGDELGRLAQTINAMIGRLERSFAEIRRFTADASHELRTPLTAIRTEAEVALGRPLSAADYQQLLGSILEECERLTRLTDQLLALSREDAGKARPARAPLDLAGLVRDVADTMRPLAEARGLALDAGGAAPLPLRGDEARLKQVFFNLLDNAIKYTPEGGRVDVRFGRRDGAAVVTVQDTGSGIPPEHLPYVFDRFYRVDPARGRAEGGTGLGLSIARSIVTAHGGWIEMASTPGRGTACTVVLPRETD